MNKFKGIILIFSIIIVISACSNNDNDKQNNENEVGNNLLEENNSNEVQSNENELNNNEQQENEADEEADDNEQSILEHQKGLMVGETGTVVSGTLDDNNRYEVTLNTIEQLTEVEGETNYNEIFIKANVTIENIEESPLPIDSIFKPTVGDEDLEDIELYPEFKEVFYTEDGSTPFDSDEIAPGEKVVVEYYFDTIKADYYRFAFGNPSDQIVTFANWKIKTKDM